MERVQRNAQTILEPIATALLKRLSLFSSRVSKSLWGKSASASKKQQPLRRSQEDLVVGLNYVLLAIRSMEDFRPKYLKWKVDTLAAMGEDFAAG